MEGDHRQPRTRRVCRAQHLRPAACPITALRGDALRGIARSAPSILRRWRVADPIRRRGPLYAAKGRPGAMPPGRPQETSEPGPPRPGSRRRRAFATGGCRDRCQPARWCPASSHRRSDRTPRGEGLAARVFRASADTCPWRRSLVVALTALLTSTQGRCLSGHRPVHPLLVTCWAQPLCLPRHCGWPSPNGHPTGATVTPFRGGYGWRPPHGCRRPPMRTPARTQHRPTDPVGPTGPWALTGFGNDRSLPCRVRPFLARKREQTVDDPSRFVRRQHRCAGR